MRRRRMWQAVLAAAFLVAEASPASAEMLIEPTAGDATLEIANNGVDLSLTGGTLKVSSVGNGPGTTLTVDAGTLAADTVNATVVQNGGVLAPGDSPGKTTIFGNYTLGPAGTLEIEIAGTTGAGLFTGNDWLDVRGTVTLAGMLDVDMLAPLSPGNVGHSFRIVSYFTLVGAFAGLADGQRFSVPTDYGSPYEFDIHYGSGSNDHIVLTLASVSTAVPEPSIIASLLCGLAALLAVGGWRWWARRAASNETAVARGRLGISPIADRRFPPIPDGLLPATIAPNRLPSARQSRRY